MIFLMVTAILLGLMLLLLMDVYIQKRDKRIIMVILILVFTLVLQNCIENELAIHIDMPTVRTAFSVYGYVIRPVLILLLSRILNKNKENLFFMLLVAINAAVYLSAFFTDIAFTIRPDNTFHRGPLGFTCHIVTAMFMIRCLYLIRVRTEAFGIRQALIPVLNMLLLIGAICFEVTFLHNRHLPVSPLTLAIVINCVFYYCWLHIEFMREHERDMEARQQLQIMISQIQPHFLFNTLSTIQAMCRTNPAGAQKTVEKFAVYLRQNLELMEQPELIPMDKEIEHTRIYADIEKERFENIDVVYDILDHDFSIPPLTIQPLVENAIRHGVRIRENGLVTVATREGDGFHEIVIKDNGKGFDPDNIEDSKGDHIGIRNVRGRIEKMCGGTMSIESRPGEGTTIVIRVPA